MENIYLNHWAIFSCAVVNLMLGALWYSPLMFYKPWLQANQLTEDDLKKVNPAKVYGITFVLAWLISYNLAFFLGDAQTDAMWGMTAGFLAGIGFSAFIFTIISLFEQRSWSYILINGGYITVYFTLIGLILGAWR